MANPLIRTERQFLFTWSCAGVALEDLNSCDGGKFGDKSLYVYRVPDDDAVCCFMQHLSQHRSVGQQITNDLLEKGFTRNTARSWWIALDKLKNLEVCLKKLDCGVCRNSRNWAEQQKAEVNNLELRSQLGRMLEKLLLEYSETRRCHPHLPNL